MPMKLMRVLVTHMLAAIGLTVSTVADAQTCSWTVSSLNFGAVDTLSVANVDATATVNITCSGFLNLLVLGSQVRVCPNIGSGSGGATASARQLDSSGNKLNYQLYTDAGHTTVWGSDFWAFPQGPPALIVSLNLVGSGSLSETLYGRVFGAQSTAPPGSYTSVFSGVDAQLRYQQYLLLAPPCSTGLGAGANTSFTVSASVSPNCLVSATTLDFGTEGVLSTNIDATNAIDVRCTAGTPWTASLNAGSGAGGTVNLRRMTGPGGATVAYTIYRNAARTEVWGDGTAGTQTVSGTGTGSAQPQTGYGRVPPQATPAPAAYSDTIVVTVTY